MRFMGLNGTQLAGVPIGIIRFAIFVPFGIYFGTSSNHWNLIKSHDVLQGAPYNPVIAKGEHLAVQWGKFGFYWNFAVWIPAIIIPPPFTIVFGFIDLAVTVMLSIVTRYQAGYAPHDVNRCRGSGSHYWQLPPNTTESFFEISARLNATKTSPFQMCKSYVQEWQYGITLSFFYGLIAVVNIITSLTFCAIAARDSQRQQRSFREWMFEFVSTFPRFIGIFLYILYFIPVVFFRCLPLSIKSRTRYGRRFAVKTSQRLPTPHEIKLKTRRNKKGPNRYKGGDGEPTGLADFLGIYDILMLVVEDLHYTDIVNLSLASKSVREAVLPVTDYDRRLQHFRRYACEPGSKERCWVCTNTICPGCKRFRNLRQTTPYWHLDSCRPYCNKCYWTTIQHSTTAPRIDSRICICAPPTTHPNTIQRMWKGASYYSRQPTNCISRNVCRTCDIKPDDELLEIREKRTRCELRDPRRHTKCKNCSKVLKGGPKWWVCKKCKKECTSLCHAPWGKKGEGDEAV
ncbi:uncharacterized protein BDR25DRAFT_52970 [Lindgomyces ingoldianus]|uniref:Uncharacterized protein n=1 Tax=Lindgomyces ingoldianus TaxID=673940 RepID=A0ACB6QRJ0_9PLEO|nr:uncharacterized protein BDR25DRAFT_52970 [Lindgomyces ingoldianus]KAF2468786.1 hypothetical protein BDR25DRAFT_52970 [Lindgomyces ingoldianus]